MGERRMWPMFDCVQRVAVLGRRLCQGSGRRARRGGRGLRLAMYHDGVLHALCSVVRGRDGAVLCVRWAAVPGRQLCQVGRGGGWGVGRAG